MDIYDQAKELNADYMDANFNVYKIQEYNQAIRLGLPTEGIKVYDLNGTFLGIAKKM